MTTSSTADGDAIAPRSKTPQERVLSFAGAAGALLLISWSCPPLWFRDLLIFGPLDWLLVAYVLDRQGSEVGRKIAAIGNSFAFVAAMIAAFRITDLHVINGARGLLFSAAFAGLAVAGLRRRLARPSLSEAAKAKLTPKVVGTLLVGGALFAGGYGYSLFALLNEQFDNAPPAVLQAPIMRKQVDRLSGLATYRVILKSDHGGLPARYSVSPQAYRSLTVGQPACVNLHKGALGARWFAVEPCE